jgi:hypothetical protein
VGSIKRNVTKIQQTALEIMVFHLLQSMKNNLTSGSVRLDQERASSERYRTETARKIHEDYEKHVKIYTDGSKMGDKVGYVIVKEKHTIKKRILP